MHIGIISTIKYHPWGGSEELWVQTAKLALQKGMEVSACFVRAAVDHPKWRDLEQARAKTFYTLPESSFNTRLASRTRALSYRLGEHMGERIRLAPLRSFFAKKPDVLLINEGGGILEEGFLSMLRKTMPQTPYVAMFHSNFDRVPADSWRPDVARFFMNAEAVLFVAEATLRATERNLATKFPNARIVRNPVNLEGLQAEPWPEDAMPRFSCVGALDVSLKGQDLLLEALSPRAWKRRDWRLSIYGAGEHAKYLQEVAEHYGLADRVEFRGQVRDVRSIWRAHHALVVPSRIESAPLVIVEAMLCGRPVISTNVGGIREWVREGRNGFISEAANAESLAVALERAWEHRYEWRQLGANAHEDAMRMYDPAPAETLLSIITGAAKGDREQLVRAAAL